MIWRVKSFGSLNLQLPDYFAALLDEDNPNVQPPVNLNVIQTGAGAPNAGGLVRSEDYLIVTVQIKGANKQTKYDALTSAFDALKGTSQKLVCLDNNGQEWYVLGRVANHAMTALVSKITLQVTDSVWRSNTEKSDGWNITASGQTHNLSVGGNVAALPIFEIKPTATKTGGYTKRRWVRLYNPNAEAVINEMVDVTNGGLDTATLVTAGKMQADGDDVRVNDNGVYVDRFLANMNASNTKIFAGPFNFQAKIEMTLSGALANTGSVTAIYVKDTPGNLAMLTRLPNARGLLEIGNERFMYTGRDISARRIDIAQRAVRNSSMASHADGDTIKWLEHDLWLYYGNASVSAPVVNALHEPAYDIATSTNASRVYTSFGDKAGVRPGSWRLALLSSSGDSHVYTGDHGDLTADPMTELGMMINTYMRSGGVIADNAILEGRFSHPGGITSVTASGEKRLVNSSSWPSFAGLQKSKDGLNWEKQFQESIPTTRGSYVAITNTTLQTLGSGYKHVRFALIGSVTSKMNDAEADLEIGDVTVVITNPITAALQVEEGNYPLDCELRNVTTGQSIFLQWTMLVNEVLTVDSDARTVTYSDGTNAFAAKSLDAPRLEYLPLQPGVNQLMFIDAGTNGVQLTTRYTERRKR